MRLQDLIPLKGLPKAPYPCNATELWFGQDNLDDYRRKGHPLYGEIDIEYRYNECGYRSPSFAATADVRILTLGCSWVFGVGVPEAAIFHQLFAERLRRELDRSVIAWNLGLPGTSNDEIVRLLHLALPELRPDVVLVLFTDLSRRDYVTSHNRHLRYSPNARAGDAVEREIANSFQNLTSTWDDRLNFFRNYKAVEALLAGHGWAFSFSRPDETTFVREHLDRQRQADRHSWLDTARDHAHPGPQTHRSMYEGFWRAFERSGGLAALAGAH